MGGRLDEAGFARRPSAVIAPRAVRGTPKALPTMGVAMAEEVQVPLDEQLSEIGAQLDWVRGYL